MVTNIAKMCTLHISSNQQHSDKREYISYVYENLSRNSDITNNLQAIVCHTSEKMKRYSCYINY